MSGLSDHFQDFTCLSIQNWYVQICIDLDFKHIFERNKKETLGPKAIPKCVSKEASHHPYRCNALVVLTDETIEKEKFTIKWNK